MKPKAVFQGDSAEELSRFLKEQRQALKTFRKVIVTADKCRIMDINRCELEFPGITFGHALLEPLLKLAGASFDPQTLHDRPPSPSGYKEFGCTARYPWGHERVL